MKSRAEGKKDVPYPPDYQAFLNPGRLRRVLVLDELGRRPSTCLKQYIQTYTLEAATLDR